MAETPLPPHEPPSLPASPLPKRTKHTELAANLGVASILNSAQPTPTPISGDPFDTMAQLPPLNAPLETPLQVKLLSLSGKAPTRGSAHAAGYDLYASAAATIPSQGRALVSTSISIAVPAGCYGRVAPRSGLAVKHGVDVGAGVIDADYRGEVKVLLFNFGTADFTVAEGDRIAQLVIEQIYTPEVVVVEELETTVRGAGGFGSTGGFGGVLSSVSGGEPTA